MEIKIGDKVKRRDGDTFFNREKVHTVKRIDEDGDVFFEEDTGWLNYKELVKVGAIEKTFREVIRDIKEGEVWESANDTITLEGNVIVTKSKIGLQGNFNINCKYKRVQLTFEEAIKLYKTGSIIESALTGNTYQSLTSEGKEYFKGQVEEILNGWYLYE